ncbi:hypothetical protein HZB78_02305 [Candidatus Collierbacteria bacterium]|nr:hypothetical protein [Candidatus Collierbacteria bacterium]
MSEGNPITPDHDFADQMDENCSVCLTEGNRGKFIQELHLRRRASTHQKEAGHLESLKTVCDRCCAGGKQPHSTLEASKSCAWRGE